MVEKLSVNIKISSLNAEHNFLIPSDMNVGEATLLIIQILLDEYPDINVNYLLEYRLMQVFSGKILNSGCSFRQLGIVQGEKLMLI